MALVPDQKFSTFDNGGGLEVGDIIVGLRNGLNTRFTYSGELPPGVVIPIANGGTGATTDVGARTNLGLGTMAVQNATMVAITGGAIEGVAITTSTAALTAGSVAAAPVAGIDIANKTYVDSMIGGTVTSVSGVLNRITSTGGATPVIDIAATYVGQTSLTTLGTIGVGTWNGTIISPIFGGTGVNNGTSTITLGGALSTIGAFTSAFTMTGNTAVTFPTSGTLATTSQIPTGAALTKVDDSNVTLTLGGSPSLALLLATSLTLGWSGQLPVDRGGSGVALATPYAVLCGGTTNTGAFQSVAGLGSTGQVLTSNGAGALPTFQSVSGSGTVNSGLINQLAWYASSGTAVSGLTTANNGVLITSGAGVPSISSTLPAAVIATIPGRLKSFQIFTSGTAATYTRPAGITSILVEVLGGGGGGGGVASGGASTVGVSSGGAPGGYSRLWIPAAASSYTYTVGALGAGGTAGANNGSGGGTTTFGPSLQATGGGGGLGSTGTASTGSYGLPGGAGGVGSNGDFNAGGNAGGACMMVLGAVSGGAGSGSIYGGGGNALSTVGTGNNAQNYGSGGGGAVTGATTNRAGGNGTAGLIVVWEYS